MNAAAQNREADGLRVLIVDDEPLARLRLQSLLEVVRQPVVHLAGQAASAQEALALAATTRPDLMLLDIHMPGMDGMALARQMRRQHPHCRLVFVTAFGEHALEAFDVAVTDYLTKPVRRERLQTALDKVWAQLAVRPPESAATAAAHPHASLLLRERSQFQRGILLEDILYARAELKYVTLFLRQQRELVWDGSLNQLEALAPEQFVRIHRNTLVQKAAMQQCKKCALADGSEGWQLQLEGVPGWLPVSRRMVAAVRQAMAGL